MRDDQFHTVVFLLVCLGFFVPPLLLLFHLVLKNCEDICSTATKGRSVQTLYFQHSILFVL